MVWNFKKLEKKGIDVGFGQRQNGATKKPSTNRSSRPTTASGIKRLLHKKIEHNMPTFGKHDQIVVDLFDYGIFNAPPQRLDITEFVMNCCY